MQEHQCEAHTSVSIIPLDPHAVSAITADEIVADANCYPWLLRPSYPRVPAPPRSAIAETLARVVTIRQACEKLEIDLSHSWRS